MLTLRRLTFVCMMFTTGVSTVPWLPQAVGQEAFTLARVIPNDVFLFETCRQNSERQFLEDYWNEVFGALKQSGIDEDLAELFGTSLGLDEQQAGEIDRLKEKFSELICEVDWSQLHGAENVFAERFTPIEELVHDQPTIMAASMVWLARTGEETKHSFESLVALLEAIVEETNHALGKDAMQVKRSTPMGAQMASLNLLGAVRKAPALPVSVAMRGDMLLIAFREDLRDDVLALMHGDSSATPLSDAPRFKAAFSQLPPAEDKMTFFDMQALLNPLQESLDLLFNAVSNPHDAIRNAGINAEASAINRKALAAYWDGDFKQALELVEEAYQIESNDSIIRYNLACFNALLGNQDEALDWLEKAVEAGFYAPYKISTDSDLKGLRKLPRYQRALAKAKELAGDHSAEDVAINFAAEGDVRRLRMQVQQAYEKKDFDQALEFIEQAYAVAPKDSQVLYAMGCLHTLKGHQDKGLDFLQQAVEAGFYCPQQISKDPDWKDVRDDPRYKKALAHAEKMAGKVAYNNRQAKSTLIKRILDRQAEAARVLDYSAAVMSTDEHSVWSESVTVLVADAADHPIYPVFSQRQPVADFARYLPQETTAFSISGGADMRQLYKFAEDTFRDGGPLGEEVLAELDQAQKKFGMNIKQDVFEQIVGDTINVTLGDGGGTVCMIKVSDEKRAYQKIDETMTALPQMITKAVAQQPALGALAAFALRCSKLTHDELDGFQNIHVAMSPKPVGVWGTADGFLIFGSSADAVALCLATSRNEHPNIRNNATAMGEAIVPEGPFVSVSLTDRRTSSKDIAMTLSASSMMGGMVAASIPKPELRPVVTKMVSIMGKLAPVVQKADFYKSVASTTTFDGQLWRTRAVTHYESPAERAAAEGHAEAEEHAGVE